MKLNGLFVAIAVFLLSLPCAFAATVTWYVSPDGTGDGTSENSPTNSINGAITAAVAGDTIILAEGEYLLTSQVTVSKKLTITGAGRQKTILRQTASGSRVMEIKADSTVIQKMGITGGYLTSQSHGAGIMCPQNASSIRIEDCDIYGNGHNQQHNNGIGVWLGKSNLIRCRVYDNNVNNYGNNVAGGGVHMIAGTIKDCIIFGNKANRSKYNSSTQNSAGGGVCVQGDGKVYNCTIVGNTDTTKNNHSGGGGGITFTTGGFTMVNTVVVGNTASTCAKAFNNAISYPCSLTEDAVSSRIFNCAFDSGCYLGVDSVQLTKSLDELFESFGDDEIIYHPKENSGLVDSGNSTKYTLSSTDIYGVARVTGDAVDIGAVERNSVYERAIFITSSFENLGAPVPAYGMFTACTEGEETVFSATGEYIASDLKTKYKVSGYKVYTNSTDGVEVLDCSGTGDSFSYEYKGVVTRVEWQWEPSAYLVKSSVSALGGGTVSPVETWVNDGDDIVLAAEPSPGYIVSSWTGDLPSAATLSDKSLSWKATSPVDAVIAFTSETNETETAVLHVAGWTVNGTSQDGEEDTLLASSDNTDFTFSHEGSTKSIEAQFEGVYTKYVINVSVSSGEGSVEATEIYHTPGEPITLVATPADGHAVYRWSGDFPEGTTSIQEETITFTPVGPMDISVSFRPVRYVSPSGSDDADGGSPLTAWKTLPHALANVAAGTIVRVLEGEYELTSSLSITNTAVLRGDGREKTILRQTTAGKRVIHFSNNNAKNSVIEKMTITGASGGVSHGCGIYIEKGNAIELLDLDVCGNGSSDHCNGGGVYVNTSNVLIKRCRIFNNNLTNGNSCGGGIACFGAGCVIENSIICGNSANRSSGSDIGRGAGGIFLAENKSCSIRNCTIAFNEEKSGSSRGGGGGFFAEDDSFMMVNTAVFGNSSPNVISRFKTTWSHDPELSLSTLSNCFANCAFDCEPIGLGSIECDASQFEEIGGLAVKPLPNFAGIDAGDNAAYALDNADITGNSRVQGDTVDIGAMEFDPSAKAVAFSPVKSEIFLGETVSFKADVSSSVSPSSYSWAVTNSSGDVVHASSGETLSFTPDSYGSYGVSLAVVSGAETLSYEIGGAITVTSPNIYVSSDADENSAVAPFATEETATTSLSEAMKWAIDGSEVFVKGTNTASVNVSKAVTLTGVGGRNAAMITPSSGRAAVIRHPKATVRNLTLNGGNSYAGSGAYVRAGKLENCRVTGSKVNHALKKPKDGLGCVLVVDSDARVTRTEIRNNTAIHASARGAGGYVLWGTIDNCLVVSNSATTGSGIIAAGAGCKIVNCTVAGNIDSTSGTYSPGIYVGSASAQVVNCASFTNLYAGVLADWKSSLSDENTAAVFSNSAFTRSDDAELPSDTCIVVGTDDFKDLVRYRPRAHRSLHNAGSADFSYPDGALDLSGRKRVIGDVDIGCYEIQSQGLYLSVR